jgi:hypothetical protein
MENHMFNLKSFKSVSRSFVPVAKIESTPVVPVATVQPSVPVAEVVEQMIPVVVVVPTLEEVLKSKHDSLLDSAVELALLAEAEVRELESIEAKAKAEAASKMATIRRLQGLEGAIDRADEALVEARAKAALAVKTAHQQAVKASLELQQVNSVEADYESVLRAKYGI